MKGGSSCWLLALTLVTMVNTLGAQSAATTPASTAITIVVDSMAPAPASEPVGVRSEAAYPSAGMRVTVGVERLAPTAEAALLANLFPTAPEEAGVKDFFFGSKKRSSNTLIIGGVGVGLIGVAVVKGNVGALMGVAGLLTSIGGLYLAF